MRYILYIKRPDEDVGFATKDFPELDHVPPLGATLFPEVVGKLNDIVLTQVVEHTYMLTKGYIMVTCELANNDDVAGFTAEKGWKLNNLA